MIKSFSPFYKKKIKLKIKGLNKEVSLHEFKKIKALDKKKLISERDSYKNQIKLLERDYHNLQVVYDPQIMDKISENREVDLRNTIYHISKQLFNKSKNLHAETDELYSQLL